MTWKNPQIGKSRTLLELPYVHFGVQFGDLAAGHGKLTSGEVVAVLEETEQYGKRWPRFEPLFLTCANLSNAWMVLWVQPSGKAAGTVFDRMVYCLVWRDRAGVIQLNSVASMVMRHFAARTWDEVHAEPTKLVLSGPVRRVAA